METMIDLALMTTADLWVSCERLESVLFLYSKCDGTKVRGWRFHLYLSVFGMCFESPNSLPPGAMATSFVAPVNLSQVRIQKKHREWWCDRSAVAWDPHPTSCYPWGIPREGASENAEDRRRS